MNLNTCFASLDSGRLRIGNSLIEREWTVSPGGLLRPESFLDSSSGSQWVTGSAEGLRIRPEGALPDESRSTGLSLFHGKRFPTEADSLVATLTSEGKEATLITVFQVFEGIAGISIQMTCRGVSDAEEFRVGEEGEQPTGIETAAVDPKARAFTDVIDCLTPAQKHLKLTAVTLRDQTDQFDELVSEEEMLLHPNKNNRSFDVILFSIEDLLSGNGVITIKEAPLPHACPVATPPALEVRGLECLVRGHGSSGDGLPGYRLTTLVYTGGSAGRIEVLQRWQRALRQAVPGRDGLVLTNTWGDRSQDSRVSEDFISREIDACARLGADVVQIDDGWQQGRTSNSIETGGVWEGFRQADSEFWSVRRDRFPNGLEALVVKARDLGLKFGLWFAPDSANEFADWEHDADCVLGFHRSMGIDCFKIDGVKATTKKAERNLRRFFDRVLEESGGAIAFDLDVTAAIRPGYFGMINVGPVFVENRYTDWHNYWPHRTLRNLWQLTRWIDPVRLRMEFLNNARNTDLYRGDPLAPGAWSPAGIFATVFFSSPLGWFEVSGLGDQYVAEVAELLEIRRAHRETLLSGVVRPIGSIPDGVSWTGFFSVDADRGVGLALVFRELSEAEEWTLCLKDLGLSGIAEIEVLAGVGSAGANAGGLDLSIPDPLGFLLVRISLLD